MLVLLLVAGLVPVQADAEEQVWLSLNVVVNKRDADGNIVDVIYVEPDTWIEWSMNDYYIQPGENVTIIPQPGREIEYIDVRVGEAEPYYYSETVFTFELPQYGADIGVYMKDPDGGNGNTNPVKYDITTNATNGTVTAKVNDALVSKAAKDENVYVTAEPNEGYELDKLTIIGPDGAEITPNADYSFTMPAGDVTIMATFKVDTTEYTVTVDPEIDSQQGTVTADRTQAKRGETVKVTVRPEADYALDKLTITGPDGEITPNTDGTFTMPKGNVTIMATFKRLYPITIADTENGTLAVTLNSASVDKAAEGDVVTITATPVTSASGEKFILDTITVTKDGSEETVNVGEDNTFIMPGCGVTVSATFKAAVVITFDYNNNTGSSATVTIPKNGSITAFPTDPESDSYFIGWYKSADKGSDPMDPDATYNDSTTVYAHWVNAVHTTDYKNNFLDTDVLTDGKKVVSMSVAQQDLVHKENMEIYLTASDIKDSIDSSVKGIIDGAAGGQKVVAYLDLTLYLSYETVAKRTVDSVSEGLDITMKVPADLVPANAGANTFQVIHYTGSGTEIIDATFDPASCNLRFKAGSFSPYALAYKPQTTAAASTSGYVLDNVPKTGDSNPLMGYSLLVLCSAAMLAAVAILDKKRAR